MSYTFYVPPSVSVSDNPIAPFPCATKYLPPGADKSDRRTQDGFTSTTDLPLVHMYVTSSNLYETSRKATDLIQLRQRIRQVCRWAEIRRLLWRPQSTPRRGPLVSLLSTFNLLRTVILSDSATNVWPRLNLHLAFPSPRPSRS